MSSPNERDITVRTFVFDTSEMQTGSILIPVEAFEHPKRGDRNMEGSVELSIGGTTILEKDWWGYLDNWWFGLYLDACEAMIEGRASEGSLQGWGVTVRFEPVANTRRTMVTAACGLANQEWQRRAAAHTPTLVESLLRACEMFVDVWSRREGRDGSEERERLVRLQTCPAPWRR